MPGASLTPVMLVALAGDGVQTRCRTAVWRGARPRRVSGCRSGTTPCWEGPCANTSLHSGKMEVAGVDGGNRDTGSAPVSHQLLPPWRWLPSGTPAAAAEVQPRPARWRRVGSVSRASAAGLRADAAAAAVRSGGSGSDPRWERVPLSRIGRITPELPAPVCRQLSCPHGGGCLWPRGAAPTALDRAPCRTLRRSRAVCVPPARRQQKRVTESLLVRGTTAAR